MEEFFKKLLDSKSEPEAWKPLIEEWKAYAAPERLGRDMFERLFHACAQPRQFKLLLSSFQSFSHAAPLSKPGPLFFEEVDDSPYRLEDWVEALEAFYIWLHEKERGSDLRTMLGYINCCIESVDSVVVQRPPLKDVLLEMLEQHGFSGF